MILSAPYVMLGLRWVPPALFLMGTTSTYITAWAFLRAVTWALLPERYYTRSEELLYTSYQSMVAFFFETWSGVQFKYYGHPIPQKSENVLYLSNHQTPEDQRTWLYGSFCEKDKMIEACLHDGMIDDRQIEMPLPIKYFGFPTLFYVSVLSGALLTKYGRRWWAVTFLLFSSYGILKMALIRK